MERDYAKMSRRELIAEIKFCHQEQYEYEREIAALRKQLGMVPRPARPGDVGCIRKGGTPPDGWLECNGQAVSRTTYSDLFAVLGTRWGAGWRHRVCFRRRGYVPILSGALGSVAKGLWRKGWGDWKKRKGRRRPI